MTKLEKLMHGVRVMGEALARWAKSIREALENLTESLRVVVEAMREYRERRRTLRLVEKHPEENLIGVEMDDVDPEEEADALAEVTGSTQAERDIWADGYEWGLSHPDDEGVQADAVRLRRG
jgi:hypothetical protein